MTRFMNRLELISSCISSELDKWGLKDGEKLEVLNIVTIQVIDDIREKVDIQKELTLQKAKDILN